MTKTNTLNGAACPGCAHHKEDDGKLRTIKLIAGAVIFAAGIIINRMPDLQPYIKFSVFIAAYIILGGDIVLRALKRIVRGDFFDENFLMSLATIGAFIIGEYPEAVAVMLFYQVGEFFQETAVNKSKKSISALMDIRPDFANLIQTEKR